MIPVAFEYAAPTSIDEAVALLAAHGDEAKILAGGHSLLPLMKLRLAVPGMLIDLGKLEGLRFIREEDGHIAIGAMTPYADLEASSLIRQRLPLLAHATSQVGDAQVRNRGTLGGALAHADPAGDMPTVVSAVGGSVLAQGPNGTREIPLSEFFVDIFTSALEPDEILTEVRLSTRDNASGIYEKFRRRQIDWAIVGVAVQFTQRDGTVEDASVVLTNVGPIPMRATGVEEALRGNPAEGLAARAAERAAEGLDPTPELNASAEYKTHLARILTRRAIERALATT